MVSKKDFYKVYSETPREGILNQFYYEHCELQKALHTIGKAIKIIKEESWYCGKDEEWVIDRTPVEKLLDILGDEEDD
ncbi:hypothetical protein IKS57_02795 [bacterium]|nr:hypothetical protein [bacterium]